MRQRTAYLLPAAALLWVALVPFLHPAEEPTQAKLPTEWAFTQSFPGKPVVAFRLDLGTLPRQALEVIPANDRGADAALAKAFLAALPQRLTGVVWVEGGGRDPEPSFLVHGEIGLTDKALLAAVTSMAQQTGAPLVQDKATGIWRMGEPDRHPQLAYAATRGRLYFGTRSAVERAVAGTAGPAAQAFPWLAELLPEIERPAAAPEGAACLRVVSDASGLEDFNRGEVSPVFAVLGLYHIPLRGAACVSLEERSWRVAVATPQEAKPRGLVRVLFPAPAAPKLLDLLPEDTQSYLYLPWGQAGEMLEALDEIEKAWGDDVAKEYFEELAELDHDLGFGFRKDLLPLFEGGGVLAVLAPRAPPPDAKETRRQLTLRVAGWDSWVVLLPCRDEAAAAKLLAQWCAAGKETVKEQTENGVTIAELQRPKGGARCAYALRDKVLYVGATAETVARVLRARGGRTLADQPDLAAHVKAAAPAGLFIYADLAMQSASLLRLAKAIPAAGPARVDDDAAAFLAGVEHPAFTPWARSGGVAFLETYYRDARAGLRLEWTGTEPAKLLRETVRTLMGRVEGGQ